MGSGRRMRSTIVDTALFAELSTCHQHDAERLDRLGKGLVQFAGPFLLTSANSRSVMERRPSFIGEHHALGMD